MVDLQTEGFEGLYGEPVALASRRVGEGVDMEVE